MNVLEFKGFQDGMHLLLWMLWWEAREATGLGARGMRCGSVSQLKIKCHFEGKEAIGNLGTETLELRPRLE